MTAPPVHASHHAPAGPAPPRRRRSARRALAAVGQLVFGHDLFLSYSRRDATPYARALARQLADRSIFLDERALEPGAVLPRRLRRAARSASVLVVVVSPGAVASSRWISLEIEHARRSPLRPVLVPIAIEPLSPGGLPPPFDRLNDALALPEPPDRFAAGTPSEATLAGIRCALGARHLRTRRRLAVAALGALVATLLAVWYLRERAADRDRAAQAWLAAADRAAVVERFDLAELAIARAVEIEPALQPRVVDRYLAHRARRALQPAGELAIRADERVAWVADRAGVPHAITRGGAGLTARNTASAIATPLTCSRADLVLPCGPTPPTLVCGDQLITVEHAPHPRAPATVDGSLLAAGCTGATARAVVEDADHRLHVERLADGGTLTPEPDRTSPGTWMAAGLCHDGPVHLFGAYVRAGDLFIVRAGDLQGGKSAVVRRVDDGGITTATVVASPSCDRFFLKYAHLVPGAGAALRPVTAPTESAWRMIDWDGLATDRDLPSTIRRLWPLPTASGYYAIYTTSHGELSLLPVTDAVVLELTPTVVATGVAAAAVAPPDPTAPHRVLTYTLEADQLVVRDRGAVLARYPHGLDEPGDIILDATATLVVVTGATRARIWRRPPPAPDRTIPAARALADLLGLPLPDDASAPR